MLPDIDYKETFPVLSTRVDIRGNLEQLMDFRAGEEATDLFEDIFDRAPDGDELSDWQCIPV